MIRGTIAASLAVLVLTGCGTLPKSMPSACPPPAFAPRPLMVGDGSLDRGFPGGVSLVDVDDDGDLDLMATRGYDTTEQNRPFRFDRSVLYLNDGAGRFSHAPESPMANADNPASGSTWGDVDNDGDLDAFVSTQHQRPDVFYRNLGHGRMAREELGEATTTAGSNFTSSWVDIDRDGDLDLLSGGPALEPGQPNIAFRNDGGRFVRVTGLPIENGAGNPGAVLWADVDNDGDQDLFVANSDLARLSGIDAATWETSQLYRNDGNWRFARTESQGFDDPAYPAISAALGDIDNDGDLDLFLGMQPGPTKRLLPDRVFRNDGRGRFILDPSFEGPPHDEMGGGVVLIDVELDGDLDLVFGNYNTGIYVYSNDGSGRFSPMEVPSLAALSSTHGAFASGDIDGDGDLDVVAGNWGETHEGEFITILENRSARCGLPLTIELRNRFGAPDPIGARVTLITRGRSGLRSQMREAMGQSNFRGQGASAFLFGVPTGERPVRAEVRWPDGRIQTVIPTGSASRLVVREPVDDPR